MPPAGRTKAIQDLIDCGGNAIKRSAWFEAELVLDRSLAMSHGRHDHTGMAEIIALLPQSGQASARRPSRLALPFALSMMR